MNLDCAQHEYSVRHFMDHFGLRVATPGERLLSDILNHFSALPYENLSKIIKWSKQENGEPEIRLPEEVMEDHLASRLGGTCFSLTFFLQTILMHNGFDCYPVSADMRAGENIHCALVVRLDGKSYLVDPGYLLNRPMLIDAQRPRLYRTEHTGIELLFNPQDGYYHLYTFSREGKKWRYRFRNLPCSPADFLRFWKESFFKNSMHGLCLTKIERNGLIYIHKHFMRETTAEGKRNFNIRRNYHQTIETIFGIPAELVEQAKAALEENLKREKSRTIWAADGRTYAPR